MDPAPADERRRALSLAALRGLTEGIAQALETLSGRGGRHAGILRDALEAFRAASGAGGECGSEGPGVATREELQRMCEMGRRVGALLAALDVTALALASGRAPVAPAPYLVP